MRLDSPSGRWVLLGTTLGSTMVALDATVVNVALPSMGRDLGTGVDGLQWIVNGYLLTLSALILLGGALGDRYGRRRMFVLGVCVFAVASVLCGLAPTLWLLVGARMLQGVGGALLTPASLAIIQSTFHPDDRGRAIGAWSGLSGIGIAVGPFVGGWLIEAASWRWIFLLNVPLAAAVVFIALRHIPETLDPRATGSLDVRGALLALLGLGGATYALVQWQAIGPTPVVLIAGAIGIGAIAAFLINEARADTPMLPLVIFNSRQFSGANLVTLVVYAALAGISFMLMLEMQLVVGYSPLVSGAAILPISVLMLMLSARAGELAQRIGPRVPMTAGPMIMAGGMLLMTRIGPQASYVTSVLPSVVVFGLGLALTVAPLTATVLAAADARQAAVASAVNNAVARVAGLLAVALLPSLVGLTGDQYAQADQFQAAFVSAAQLGAGVAALGGAVAWLTIRDDLALNPEHSRHTHCSLDAPPLRRPAA